MQRLLFPVTTTTSLDTLQLLLNKYPNEEINVKTRWLAMPDLMGLLPSDQFQESTPLKFTDEYWDSDASLPLSSKGLTLRARKGAIALSRTLAEQKDNVVHCFLEPYAVERLCRTEKLNDRPHQTLLDHMLYHIASFKCIRSVYTIDYLSGAEFRLESVAFEGLVEDKPDELLYYNLATLVATLSTENTSQIHSTIALIDAAVKKCFDYNPTDPCVTKKEAWLAFFGTAETMKAYPSLRTPVVFEAPAVDWHATFLNDATLSTVAVAPTI